VKEKAEKEEEKWEEGESVHRYVQEEDRDGIRDGGGEGRGMEVRGWRQERRRAEREERHGREIQKEKMSYG